MFISKNHSIFRRPLTYRQISIFDLFFAVESRGVDLTKGGQFSTLIFTDFDAFNRYRVPALLKGGHLDRFFFHSSPLSRKNLFSLTF